MVARHLTAAGGLGPTSAVRRCRRRSCADHEPNWSPSTGSPNRCAWPPADRPRQLLDRFAGPDRGWRAEPVTARCGRRQNRASRTRRGFAREAQSGPGKSTCCASAWRRSNEWRPQPGEDVALAAEAVRLQATDDLRLGRPGGGARHSRAPTTRPAEHSPSLHRRPRRRSNRPSGEPVRRPNWRPAGRGELSADRSDRRPGPLPRRSGRPSRDGWSRSPSVALELAGLTRKYGTTLRRGARLVAESAIRLDTTQSSDDRIGELRRRDCRAS